MTTAAHTATAPLRLGIVGLRRGRALARIVAAHPEAALTAVCDRSPGRLDRVLEEFADTGAAGCADFDQLLEHDIHAVILANDATAHVPLALKAMQAGLHVLSEVPACATMGEAVRLVEAAEQAGTVYMMAENYCLSAVAVEMRRRYLAGDIGVLQHAEGEYVHDTEDTWPQLTGGLAEHWRNWRSSTFYCTHSLGPLLHITDSRVRRVVAMETPNRVGLRHGRLHGDSAVLLCQTSGDATMKSLQSHGGIKREPPSTWLCLYGSEGTMEASRWDRTRLFINTRARPDHVEELEPSLLDADVLAGSDEVAKRFLGSHGGSDFMAVHAFVQSALGRIEPPIDAQRAVDMTMPGLLGFRSIVEGNIPFEVPDLRGIAARDKWRGDSWTFAGRSCSFPTGTVAEEVYQRQRAVAATLDYPPVERM